MDGYRVIFIAFEYLSFEFVSRYRDLQLQVGKITDIIMYNFKQNLC